ncbi:MAG: 30S ribosomal protein S6e [Candidatus Hodarchaeota archaeon]|jgi:small subunit ribosomal protein S6e
MAKFQLNLSDPESKRTHKIEIDDAVKTQYLIGKHLNEVIDGSTLGFDGYSFRITGGSDGEGFPMNPSLPGSSRRRILTAGGIGYHPKRRGIRRRKSVRGNEIGEDIYQINLRIEEKGPRPIEELL